MSTTVSQIEKLLDFLQGEPESLHLLDKSKSYYVINGIKPEVALGAGCSWQQRPALVEADRIYAKPRLLCGFTNLDRVNGTVQTVLHKKIIHSGWYSRVKPAFTVGEVEMGALYFPRPEVSEKSIVGRQNSGYQLQGLTLSAWITSPNTGQNLLSPSCNR